MTKRAFTIDWPDDNGPMWMNKDNLLTCLTKTCPNTVFKVEDITPAFDKVMREADNYEPLDDDFIPADRYGGNFDDAFYGGVQSGREQLAAELYCMMNPVLFVWIIPA